MGDRGHRAFPVLNPLLEAKWRKKQRAKYYERIASQRSGTNTAAPESLSYTHLNNGGKRKYLDDRRDRDISDGNLIMIDKIIHAESAIPHPPPGGAPAGALASTGPLSTSAHREDAAEALPPPQQQHKQQHQRKSLSGPSRKQEEVRIASSNAALFRRLLQAQPALKKEHLDERWIEHERLRQNLHRRDVQMLSQELKAATLDLDSFRASLEASSPGGGVQRAASPPRWFNQASPQAPPKYHPALSPEPPSRAQSPPRATTAQSSPRAVTQALLNEASGTGSLAGEASAAALKALLDMQGRPHSAASQELVTRESSEEETVGESTTDGYDAVARVHIGNGAGRERTTSANRAQQRGRSAPASAPKRMLPKNSAASPTSLTAYGMQCSTVKHNAAVRRAQTPAANKLQTSLERNYAPAVTPQTSFIDKNKASVGRQISSSMPRRQREALTAPR